MRYEPKPLARARARQMRADPTTPEAEGLGERKPPKLQISQVRGSVQSAQLEAIFAVPAL